MSEYYFDYGKGGITKDGMKLEQTTVIENLNWMDSRITELEAENARLETESLNRGYALKEIIRLASEYTTGAHAHGD